MPRDLRSSADSNPEDLSRRRFLATRCVWTTGGQTCLLTGSSSPDTGGRIDQSGTVRSPRCFCPWHASRTEISAGSGSLDDFTLWLEQHLAAFPPSSYGPSEFTEHAILKIWEAVCGRTALEPKPREKRDTRPGTQKQRAEAFAKIRELANSIGARRNIVDDSVAARAVAPEGA